LDPVPSHAIDLKVESSFMRQSAPYQDDEQEVYLLTAVDRCDACGSQAYVLVILPEDRALTFCGHHWNKHAEKLVEVAVDIVDETDRIL
jgi:hypothetical protein